MCVSYISVAVIELPHQKQFTGEDVYLGFQVQRNQSPSGLRGTAVHGRHCSQSRKQRDHILNYKGNTSRMTQKRAEVIHSQTPPTQ